MGLRLPECVNSISLDTDDRRVAFMPFGFIAFAEEQLGNGDQFGLYWPIGQEGQPPIVAETFHDEGAVMPAFSSLEVFLSQVAEQRESGHPEFPSYEADCLSPLACYEEARRMLRNRNFDAAVALLEAAVAKLPEYTGALALLTAQYLRQKRKDEACRMAARTIISPPSFGSGEQVQRICSWFSNWDEGPADLVQDPIWQSRASLASIPSGGTKESAAYPILAEAIDIYAARGHIVTALTLMQTYGEHMNYETISFQQRYRFDCHTHWQRQRDMSTRLPDGPRFLT